MSLLRMVLPATHKERRISMQFVLQTNRVTKNLRPVPCQNELTAYMLHSP